LIRALGIECTYRPAPVDKMLKAICVFGLSATAAYTPASKIGQSRVTPASPLTLRSVVAPRCSTLKMDEVEDKVKSIISEQLGVEIASVTPAASFTEDLGADSLDAVELIMAIEEAFDIEIPDEEAESMTTPAECVTAIKAKL